MKVPLQEKFVFHFSVDDFKVCCVVFENSTKPVNYFFIRAILLVMKKRGSFSLKQKTNILAINFGSSTAKNKKKCPPSEAKDGTVPGPR